MKPYWVVSFWTFGRFLIQWHCWENRILNCNWSFQHLKKFIPQLLSLPFFASGFIIDRRQTVTCPFVPYVHSCHVTRCVHVPILYQNLIYQILLSVYLFISSVFTERYRYYHYLLKIPWISYCYLLHVLTLEAFVSVICRLSHVPIAVD